MAESSCSRAKRGSVWILQDFSCRYCLQSESYKLEALAAHETPAAAPPQQQKCCGSPLLCRAQVIQWSESLDGDAAMKRAKEQHPAIFNELPEGPCRRPGHPKRRGRPPVIRQKQRDEAPKLAHASLANFKASSASGEQKNHLTIWQPRCHEGRAEIVQAKGLQEMAGPPDASPCSGRSSGYESDRSGEASTGLSPSPSPSPKASLDEANPSHEADSDTSPSSTLSNLGFFLISSNTSNSFNSSNTSNSSEQDYDSADATGDSGVEAIEVASNLSTEASPRHEVREALPSDDDDDDGDNDNIQNIDDLVWELEDSIDARCTQWSLAVANDLFDHICDLADKKHGIDVGSCIESAIDAERQMIAAYLDDVKNNLLGNGDPTTPQVFKGTLRSWYQALRMISSSCSEGVSIFYGEEAFEIVELPFRAMAWSAERLPRTRE